MSKAKRIGVCTGGGDAPGLNAVIRAIVKYGRGQLGWEVFGVEECFHGLMYPDTKSVWPLDLPSCQGLLGRGGTILGTTNRGDPFGTAEDGRCYAEIIRENYDRYALDGLILIGGDGTQKIGHRLSTEYGIPIVGVPKTIDNDLEATDFTFGFWSAVDVATDALDRLHTTAESHDRVMILEVMGRTAGWIALYAGIAGGADCIAIPEVPYDPARFIEKIERRRKIGRHFTIVVVAEGARPMDSISLEGVSGRRGAGDTLTELLRAEFAQRDDATELRCTVLGHIQRGGSPTPFDRVLATQYGVKAVQLVESEGWGELVCLRGGEITSVPIADVASAPREVDPQETLLGVATSVGIELGGEIEPA